MINLIIMLIPLIGYNFHFWFLLFLAVAICRYRFNRYKFLLIFALIGTTITGLFPIIIKLNDPQVILLSFQIIVTFWSLIYNIKKRIWKWDVVFFIMEPALLIILSYYFITGFPLTTVVNRLFYWISVYIVIQVLLILVKIFIAYKISYEAEDFRKRLKLLISYLPHIEPSFGLGDFATSGGAAYCSPPTTLTLCINKVELMKSIVYAEAKGDIDGIKNIKEKKKEYAEKSKIYERLFKVFKFFSQLISYDIRHVKKIWEKNNRGLGRANPRI